MCTQLRAHEIGLAQPDQPILLTIDQIYNDDGLIELYFLKDEVVDTPQREEALETDDKEPVESHLAHSTRFPSLDPINTNMLIRNAGLANL